MMGRPPQPTVAETYDQPGGLIAQYLAERIEGIKREHQALKKLEAAKQITARELTRRVESIQSSIRWLKEECLSYAENRGTVDDLIASLEIVRFATKDIRKRGRSRDARDYWVTKTTATLQGWLERNHLLLSIADIEPNFLEEEWNELRREAAIEEIKRRPFEIHKRRIDPRLERFDEGLRTLDEAEGVKNADEGEAASIDTNQVREALKSAEFIPANEESAKAVEKGEIDPNKIVRNIESIPIPETLDGHDKDDKEDESDGNSDAETDPT